MDENIIESPSDKERIGVIVSEILTLTGLDLMPVFRETLNPTTDETDLVVVITTQEYSQFLIGHHGSNLAALEHLAHAASRQQGIRTRFRIDVNDYREGKKTMFIRMARDAAADAIRTKKPVVLRPMNAYERRLIHTELVENPEVTTESISTGGERKVVVKPQSILEL